MSISLNVGIGDIATYIPRPSIDLNTLVQYRSEHIQMLARRLQRALVSTGQKRFRFPNSWEDTSTMAAQATHALLQVNQESISQLRYLIMGTETGLDMSKPIAAYVQGMLQKNDFDIPEELATFQVQHACAGGTYGILAILSMLAVEPRKESTGIVVCSDIARYSYPSTAEITQGAGAVSVLLEKNPRLLNVDIQHIGYSSRDVDDFFRPLNSDIAVVRGKYSVECYRDALDSAFNNYCTLVDCSPVEVLNATDYYVLHVPFYSMGYLAMNRLLGKYLNLNEKQSSEYLHQHNFESQLHPIARVGNTYTASVYLSLQFLLKNCYEKEGDAIVGRSILVASYGSGNTMAVFSCTILPGALDVIKSWNLHTLLSEYDEKDISAYTRWLEQSDQNRELSPEQVLSKHYYLSHLRDDGYREYAFKS